MNPSNVVRALYGEWVCATGSTHRRKSPPKVFDRAHGGRALAHTTHAVEIARLRAHSVELCVDWQCQSQCLSSHWRWLAGCVCACYSMCCLLFVLLFISSSFLPQTHTQERRSFFSPFFPCTAHFLSCSSLRIVFARLFPVCARIAVAFHMNRKMSLSLVSSARLQHRLPLCNAQLPAHNQCVLIEYDGIIGYISAVVAALLQLRCRTHVLAQCLMGIKMMIRINKWETQRAYTARTATATSENDQMKAC